MKENELLEWLIAEKANAMKTCTEYRKANDVTGALIAGTEASAFALVIKRTKEIFNISSNVPVSGEFSLLNHILEICNEDYGGDEKINDILTACENFR